MKKNTHTHTVKNKRKSGIPIEGSYTLFTLCRRYYISKKRKKWTKIGQKKKSKKPHQMPNKKASLDVE
jgi:hypothetical protein